MPKFIFGLNTSTIRPASLMDKIKITRQAGYDAIELWADDVEQYVREGHPLADVAKALDDHGLIRPSMISLRNWCEPDDARFADAMEDCRRRLDMAQALKVRRIVAGPPGGEVTNELAIKRYGQVLELSVSRGVPASLEFLGFVAGINTLERAWAICAGVGSPAGTVTPDVWHMYRGNSSPDALDAIPADHISCFHWNDAPAAPPREKQTDADRVYPGDGIVDLHKLAKELEAKQFAGVLSLELFNKSYWQQDPLEVARTGLAKMKQSVSG